VREMAQEGFRRMHETVRAAVAGCGEQAATAVVLRALAQAYLDFALQHTAYFRVMFDAPPAPERRGAAGPGGRESECRGAGGETLRQSPPLPVSAATPCPPTCAEGLNVPVAALATVHGLVSLFLSGRLDDVARSRDQLLALAEECLAPYAGRSPVDTT